MWLFCANWKQLVDWNECRRWCSYGYSRDIMFCNWVSMLWARYNLSWFYYLAINANKFLGTLSLETIGFLGLPCIYFVLLKDKFLSRRSGSFSATGITNVRVNMFNTIKAKLIHQCTHNSSWRDIYINIYMLYNGIKDTLNKLQDMNTLKVPLLPNQSEMWSQEVLQRVFDVQKGVNWYQPAFLIECVIILE